MENGKSLNGKSIHILTTLYLTISDSPPIRKSPRLQALNQKVSDIFVHPYVNGKVLQTVDTLHNLSSNESLSDITLRIVSLDTENLYTPKKGLYWLRKGTKQLVALKSDEDLASCRREYGQKVPLKIACECIVSSPPGKKRL